MGLLPRLMTRLATRVDDNLSPLDRHLEVAIPPQRTPEIHECCDCCRERFAPASCPLVPHRRPCPDCENVA